MNDLNFLAFYTDHISIHPSFSHLYENAINYVNITEATFGFGGSVYVLITNRKKNSLSMYIAPLFDEDGENVEKDSVLFRQHLFYIDELSMSVPARHYYAVFRHNAVIV